MKQIKTEILINAPIEKIWAVLTNVTYYPSWNPFITNIDGDTAANKKIKVTVKPAGQKPMTFKAHVITKTNYEFVWLGGLAIPGIFNGRHQLCLEAVAPNVVKLIHNEVFSGVLSGLIFAWIGKSTKEGFNNMNQALKQRCEAA